MKHCDAGLWELHDPPVPVSQFFSSENAPLWVAGFAGHDSELAQHDCVTSSMRNSVNRADVNSGLDLRWGGQMEVDLTLPGGEVLSGAAPVVIIGPNGSGKTRSARQIQVPPGHQIEFINALRNTRVAQEIPSMGQDAARNNLRSQRNQARANHWEITSDFDYLLARLVGQASSAALDFQRRFLENPDTAGTPENTPLIKIEAFWRRVFPGRRLRWEDLKPTIDSVTSGTQVSYTGSQMSDGEKAALYMAGLVFITEPATVLVVDEPETHFHSLLAVRVWNDLEDARPDLRFIYITHDLTFAMSRSDGIYVLASPTNGLRQVAFGEGVPDDVVGALLGSASLSFYASRVVFCEGEDDSLDSRFYNAWFNGADTVVRPVGSCHRVLRCVEALREGGLTLSLNAIGIIDRDYYPDNFFSSLSDGVKMLPVHEIESLFVLPGVVRAIAKHLNKAFDDSQYLSVLRSSITPENQRQITIQRWKSALEPRLTGLVAATSKRDLSVEQLKAEIPNIFNYADWPFSPDGILGEELAAVDAALDESADPISMLALLPGKPLLPKATNYLGIDKSTLLNLVISTLRSPEPEHPKLREELVAALQPHLPDRHVATAGTELAILTPE